MKKNIVIGNSFSINMINGFTNLSFTPVDQGLVKIHIKDKNIISIVGHADTAAVFSTLLGIEIPMNRVSWKWDDTVDELIVGQLTGPRLPEGATTLPDGATIKWWLVTKNEA